VKKLKRRFDELEKVTIIDGRYDYCLAINPFTEPSYAKKLQSALDQMKSDGSYDALRLKYLH
jgi:ABC-type amino acid transport substrate-binding protein